MLIGNGFGIPFQRRRGSGWGYTKTQTQSFIDDGYIPIATHQDLNAVRANQTDRVWAAGTEWEMTKSSTGLSDKYIQVADIDLYDECREGGAYWNDGVGWLPIGSTNDQFGGVYNGGGYIINGLYINKGVDVGLFGVSNINAELTNIINLNIKLIATGNYVGGIVADNRDSLIEYCFSSGFIYQTGNLYAGGIAGGYYQATNTINNCFSNICIIATSQYIGGIIGQLRESSILTNSISIGSIYTSDSNSGGLVGIKFGDLVQITSSYYNTQTSGQSDTGKGTPKTTSELLSGTPSAEIFTDWDTEIDAVTGKPVWQFKEGRYPILSIFGEMAANIPAPVNLQVDVVDGAVQLDWTDHSQAPTPIGYNVYHSIDNGAWEKVNTELITNKSFIYEPTSDGEYNYFVKAVYYIRGFNQETGNSVTTVGDVMVSASWDTEVSSTTIQGTGDITSYFERIRLVTLADNGDVNNVIATYSNPIINGATDGSDGNVMVELPKLYYKEIFNASDQLQEVRISELPLAGFTLHPCFSWGVGRDHVYIGAYEASYIGEVMASVSGQPVQTSQDLAEFRAAAALRGEGWHPYGFWNNHLIQLLYYVWSKDRDSQTVIPGYTKESGWAYAKTRPTGRSNILIEVNGSVNADKEGVDSDLTNLSASDAVANRFLFIENFYGHIWKFIDGCSFDGRIGEKKTAFTTPDPRIFSSDQTSILANYDDMDIDLLSVDTTSYIRNVGKAFLPVEGGASSSTFYADSFYSYLTDAANRNYLRSVLAGGTLSLGVNAGVAACALPYALSYSYSSVGSRLCYSKY